MGRSYLSMARASLASLTLTVGLAGSALVHGFLLSLPMPEQVALKPEPSPPAPEVVQVSLRPVPSLRRAARSVTVKPRPQQKQELPKRIKRLKQPPAIAPVPATQPAQTPLLEHQPSASPEPLSNPASPEASPLPERSQQPNSPNIDQNLALFSDFPQADQAFLCGNQQGDCWRVADTRWNLVRKNLEAKLQAKGQELREIEQDDDHFRIYEVYENGERKSFVHMLSDGQAVTYILCNEQLSKNDVKARMMASKPDSRSHHS